MYFNGWHKWKARISCFSAVELLKNNAVNWCYLALFLYSANKKTQNTRLRLFHVCIFPFFISCTNKKLMKQKSNIRINKKKNKFAACTEHDREYTFHYFRNFHLIFSFSLLSSLPIFPPLNYLRSRHTHTHNQIFTHTHAHAVCWY